MARNILTASDVLTVIDARTELAVLYSAKDIYSIRSRNVVCAARGNLAHLDHPGAISIAFMGDK